MDDQRAEDKGRSARNHGVFISNREIYEAIQQERRDRELQGNEIRERVRAVEIKVLGILVPGGLVGVYVIKELFFGAAR